MSEHLSENSAMESIAVALAVVDGRTNLTMADVYGAEAVVLLLQNYPEIASTLRIGGNPDICARPPGVCFPVKP